MPRQPPAALAAALQDLRQLTEQLDTASLGGSRAVTESTMALCSRVHLHSFSSGMPVSELVAMEVPLVLALAAKRLFGEFESWLEPAAPAAPLLPPLSVLGLALNCARLALPAAPDDDGAKSSIARQVVSAGLLPALGRALGVLSATLLERDGATLSAAAARGSESCTFLAVCFMDWVTTIVELWPGAGGFLASADAGPLAVPAARLLSAATRLAAYHLEARARLEAPEHMLPSHLVECCHMGALLATAVDEARGGAAARQPYAGQLLREPSYAQAVVTGALFCVSSHLQRLPDGGGGSSRAGSSSSSSSSEARDAAIASCLGQLAGVVGVSPALLRHMFDAFYALPPDADEEFDDVDHVPAFDELHPHAWRQCVRELQHVSMWPDARQQRALLPPLPALLLEAAALFDGGDDSIELEDVQLCVQAAADVTRCLQEQQRAPVALPALLRHLVRLLQRLTGHSSTLDGFAPGLALSMCVWRLLSLLRMQHAFDSGEGLAAAQGAAAPLCAAVEEWLRMHARLQRADGPPVFTTLMAVAHVFVDANPDVRRGCWVRLIAAAPGPAQQQYAALVVTWVKLVHHIVTQDIDGPVQFWLSTLMPARSALASACCMLRGVGGGGGRASEAQLPWPALAAQAMHFTGLLLAACLRSSRRPVLFPEAPISMCASLLRGCAEGLQLFDAAVAAAAAAAWPDAQPLLQQQEPLLRHLQQGAALARHAAALCRAPAGRAAGEAGVSDSENGPPEEPDDPQHTWVAAAAAGVDAALLAAVDAAGSDAQVLRVLRGSFVATSLPAQLHDAALELSAALPHHFACNNPGCVCLAGGSELALVSGRRSQCAGCHTARYCSEACQAAHWRHHKPVCRRLKRAAAAATAAAGTEVAAAPAAAAVSGLGAGGLDNVD